MKLNSMIFFTFVFYLAGEENMEEIANALLSSEVSGDIVKISCLLILTIIS